VVAGHWSLDVCWLSLVFALGPTSVIFGKHIDKLEQDKNKGVHSLPVILGDGASRKLVAGLLVGQYLLTALLVLNGSFGWALLLVFANLPKLLKLLKVFRRPKPGDKPRKYPANIWPLWFSAHAFGHTRVFTSLFLVGVVVDISLA
jgi:1,4-dihydroxy-2-naphthoate octaprenyltransferase